MQKCRGSPTQSWQRKAIKAVASPRPLMAAAAAPASPRRTLPSGCAAVTAVGGNLHMTEEIPIILPSDASTFRPTPQYKWLYWVLQKLTN
eukprot:COSAG01_NODE_3027_length_6704_cov_2.846026_10_plen_90_part_00